MTEILLTRILKMRDAIAELEQRLKRLKITEMEPTFSLELSKKNKNKSPPLSQFKPTLRANFQQSTAATMAT
tara:strand:+ start:156 stop:371 length:216 start_codon:yes stop_codon:yes gene_type:complete